MHYLIRAYTQLNLGDDLFIHTLCNRYPDHNFHLVCKKSKAKPFTNIENLVLHYAPEYMDSILFKLGFSNNRFNKLEQELARKCDGVIHIGGSIFMESPNWELGFNRTKNIVDISKNYYIIGSNFGPFKSSKYQKSYYELFKNVNDICFRDEYSYGIFSELNNIRYAPDVVLTLDNNAKLDNPSQKRVVISVVNLSNRVGLEEFQKNYVETISKLSMTLLNRGVEVTLMSFCKVEDDHVTINEIKNKIKSDKVDVYNYNGSIDEALNVLQSANSIVASRFHAMILGWLMDKNVLPIIYSNKSLNVIKDVNYNGYYCKINEIENFDMSEAMFQLIEGEFSLNSDYIVNAQNQFLALDRILKD